MDIHLLWYSVQPCWSVVAGGGGGGGSSGSPTPPVVSTPSVSSVSPATATQGQSASFSITGSNLQSGTLTATLSTVTCSVTVSSATQASINCPAPITAGSAVLQINNNGQALGSPITITVNSAAVVISSISPATANTNPTIFTVAGSNLSTAITATIGGQTCTQQSGGSAAQITFICPLPSGAGNASFIVSSGGAALTGGTATITLIKLAAGNTGQLNDTGSQTCFDSSGVIASSCVGTGQDGEFGRDAVLPTKVGFGMAGFDWTKVDANGYAMPNNAASWACIKDNVTGLIWEVKTNDGGLRDYLKTYTNLNDNGVNDASSFVTAVNILGLCGASSWRLPTLDELNTIGNEGVVTSSIPAIDSSAFLNTASANYWSSTSALFPSAAIWSAAFWSPGLGTVAGSQTNLWSVRLVRSSTLALMVRYSISSDYQEVTDNKTGLIWRRCAEGMVASVSGCSGTAATYTWSNAMIQAKNQAILSGKAWRVPNLNEIKSIVDLTQTNPTIDHIAFPSTPGQNFWSSTAMAWPLGSVTPNPYVWQVDFLSGGAILVSPTFLYSTRLVR